MINVLLFAYLRETIGQDQLQIDAEAMTVADIKAWLMARYPTLSLENVMSAVNEEFAMDHTTVHAGDHVAFIPPISGG